MSLWLTSVGSLKLLHTIHASGGTANDCLKITAKVENYHRNLQICATKFDNLLSLAVTKAVEDATTIPTHLPTTFPCRTIADDRQDGIAPFTDKLPADEVTDINPNKCKTETRAQKALRALTNELEDSTLLFPSAYHKQICDHIGMKTAVDTERKLCEGLAAEALDKLRLHLTTAMALEQGWQQISGVVENTEVDRRLMEKCITTDRAKYAYCHNRHLLCILGMEENDTKFKPLCDEDCYTIAITAEEC